MNFCKDCKWCKIYKGNQFYPNDVFRCTQADNLDPVNADSVLCATVRIGANRKECPGYAGREKA